MATGRRLVFRAVVAVLLMVLFFVFAVAIALALLWLALILVDALGAARGRAILLMIVLAAACVFAAAVILWSLVPRIDRFEPPGPELTEHDAPELFTEIQRLAAATQQAAPRHVYLVDDVNAFVTERGGWMGFGSQRVMGVGLPLLELLSVAQLRGVIAHELGHFHGGDTKLGPWIYKTRAAIGRTLTNLSKVGDYQHESGWVQFFVGVIRVVRAPFLWFGNGYMQVTQGISRAQEYDADALAASVVGSQTMADGLKAVHAGAVAYHLYFHSEVAPIMEAGFRPPIAEGYRAFMRVQALAQVLERSVAEELEGGEQDPYDSHPPLRERVAAVAAIAAAERMPDPRPAIELLADVAALEARLLAGTEAAPVPIAWSEVVGKVYEPSWRARVALEHKALAQLSPAELPRETAEIRRRSRKILGAEIDDADDHAVTAWFGALVATAIMVALLDRGWTPVTAPGEQLDLVREGMTVTPFVEVRDYFAGTTELAAWQARVAALGLADAVLGKRR